MRRGSGCDGLSGQALVGVRRGDLCDTHGESTGHQVENEHQEAKEEDSPEVLLHKPEAAGDRVNWLSTSINDEVPVEHGEESDNDHSDATGKETYEEEQSDQDRGDDERSQVGSLEQHRDLRSLAVGDCQAARMSPA